MNNRQALVELELIAKEMASVELRSNATNVLDLMDDMRAYADIPELKKAQTLIDKAKKISNHFPIEKQFEVGYLFASLVINEKMKNI